MKNIPLTVIGAGCGGQAIAGYAASQGYDVTLYNRSEDRISPLRETLEIRLEGAVNTFGKLKKVTTNIQEALQNAKLIMVVTTADAHKDLAQNMSPYLKDGQMIVLNPGRTFGSLDMINTFNNNGVTKDIIVAEANTLVYATRLKEPGLSSVKGVKNEVVVSSFPVNSVYKVVATLNDLYPQFKPTTNFFETSIGNLGSIFHPIITLFNKDKIIRKEHFDFYTDGVTDEVANYIDKVDNERLKIAKFFNTNVPCVSDWLTSRYNIPQSKDKSVKELLKTNPVYQGISAPTNIDSRYLWEDVPTGLVPFSCVAKACGLKTPYIDNLINMSSNVLKKDFYSSGRNLQNLGLTNENAINQIKEFLNPNVKYNVKRVVKPLVDDDAFSYKLAKVF